MRAKEAEYELATLAKRNAKNHIIGTTRPMVPARSLISNGKTPGVVFLTCGGDG